MNMLLVISFTVSAKRRPLVSGAKKKQKKQTKNKKQKTKTKNKLKKGNFKSGEQKLQINKKTNNENSDLDGKML